MKKIPFPIVHTGFLGVKYKLSVLRALTGKLETVAKGHNLILDAGLDMLATNLTANLTRYCHVGTGTGVFQRDSGTTTVSRAGTTLTASGAYFEANDVGRLFKFDSGEEVYINAFTSTTEVETVDSGTIAADEGTMWYVDRTQLDAETSRTSSYRTDSGDNETTLSAGVLNYKRTHSFSAVGSNVTYNEIGWGPSNSTALYNGSIITGGVSLLTGDILIVESNLELVQSPQTPTAQSDIGSGGFDTTGDIQIESTGLIDISSSGSAENSSFKGSMEPSLNGSGTSNRTLSISSTAQAFTTYGQDVALGSDTRKVYANSTYNNGDHFIDKSATYSISEGNGTINTICLMDNVSSYPTLRVLLDNPQTKLSSETFALGFRLSWGRVLSN